MRRPLLILTLLAVLAVPSAHADGDPASDYLVSQAVYFGVELPRRDAVAALDAAVTATYEHGYRVHVAIVATRTDLGSIPSLFGHPTKYAQFLGTELRPYYIGPLLIVMPAGFGIYDGGRTTAAESAVLARRPPPGRSRDQLTHAAAAAVDKLRIAGALKSRDILAPSATPFSSTGTKGRRMKLQYNVYDDSGHSTVVLQVIVGKKALTTITVSVRDLNPQQTHAVFWTVPATLPRGQPKLCVSARDPAGNRSAPFCTALVIKAP